MTQSCRTVIQFSIAADMKKKKINNLQNIVNNPLCIVYSPLSCIYCINSQQICFWFVLQSGCCKPPTECGFTYMNETFWSSSGGVVYSTDCNTWNNDQERLCYSCNSCKAGLLANLRKSWRKVSVINIVILIILVIAYVVGCAAFRNNRRIDNDEPYGEARMTKSQPSRIHL